MSAGRKTVGNEGGLEKGGSSRGNRRPVYKPKAKEGVTDFQALLKITAASNDAIGSGGGGVKVSKNEAEKVVAEDEKPKDENDKVTDTSNANNNNGNDEPKLKADNEDTLKKPEGVELACNIRDPQFSVFIPRDYSGTGSGGPNMVTFSRKFPKELHGVVSEGEFRFTVDTINDLFYSAQKLSCGSLLESVVGYLTCTLIYVCKKTRMEKAFERIGQFLYQVNEEVYHPLGLHVVHPMCRGLRTLVIRSIANYPLYSYEKEDEK